MEKHLSLIELRKTFRFERSSACFSIHPGTIVHQILKMVESTSIPVSELCSFFPKNCILFLIGEYEPLRDVRSRFIRIRLKAYERHYRDYATSINMMLDDVHKVLLGIIGQLDRTSPSSLDNDRNSEIRIQLESLLDKNLDEATTLEPYSMVDSFSSRWMRLPEDLRLRIECLQLLNLVYREHTNESPVSKLRPRDKLGTMHTLSIQGGLEYTNFIEELATYPPSSTLEIDIKTALTP